MASLQGDPGELRMTLQITRAATGKTETVELIGKATTEQLAELGLNVNTEPQDGGHTQYGGEERGN